jgi:hypothetical protein
LNTFKHSLGGRFIIFIVVSIFILFIFVSGVKSISNDGNIKSIESMEEAIMKASITCYALEGSYPPNVDYLSQNYGIILDKDNYFYHYEITGSNLAPYIRVFKRWE